MLTFLLDVEKSEERLKTFIVWFSIIIKCAQEWVTTFKAEANRGANHGLVLWKLSKVQGNFGNFSHGENLRKYDVGWNWWARDDWQCLLIKRDWDRNN